MEQNSSKLNVHTMNHQITVSWELPKAVCSFGFQLKYMNLYVSIYKRVQFGNHYSHSAEM